MWLVRKSMKESALPFKQKFLLRVTVAVLTFPFFCATNYCVLGALGLAFGRHWFDSLNQDLCVITFVIVGYNSTKLLELLLEEIFCLTASHAD